MRVQNTHLFYVNFNFFICYINIEIYSINFVLGTDSVTLDDSH